MQPLIERTLKERRENAFAHFRPPDYPGNRRYVAFVARDLDPVTWGGALEEALPGSGVYLEYDNFESWEVTFNVVPRRRDIAGQLEDTIYGYYTEETAKTTEPHELELRDDKDTRWHEVFSLDGTVEAALEDPEVLKADLDFGITLKQELRDLPFDIADIPDEGLAGKDRRAALSINSIQLDGQELTWVKSGRASGRVVLPETMPAGSKIHLRMNYSTRAIVKVNHAFSLFTRFGWMPFVSFGDFIDDFEMTIKVPAQTSWSATGSPTARSCFPRSSSASTFRTRRASRPRRWTEPWCPWRFTWTRSAWPRWAATRAYSRTATTTIGSTTWRSSTRPTSRRSTTSARKWARAPGGSARISSSPSPSRRPTRSTCIERSPGWTTRTAS
jgi:hypothetical protein